MTDQAEMLKACTEVLEVLKYIEKEEYDKIPPDLIQFFEDNCDKSHKVDFEARKPIEENNLLKETYSLLAVLYRDYWATAEQRIIFDELLEQNDKKAKLEEYEKMLGEE